MSEHKVKEAQRAEEYKKDPSKFYHQDDIVLAVIKTDDNGMGVLHGAVPRGTMEQALARVTHRTYMIFQQMDITQMMKQKERESGIIS